MTILNKASDIAQTLATRLATITVANGFNTDVGLRVMRGRRRIDDNQIPCAVLAELVDTPTAAQGRIPQAEIWQSYMLIAYDACHPDHPNDKAHLLIKDLKRAIFADGVTLGGNVLRVEYRGRDIGPRGDGVEIVCASVEIAVKFVEDLANP